ncbi:MAG: GIY-YIG nuclease family protein [Rhodospirillaceae bacterium]|nr:GIY-YIG nuclease family protein [Rhodospirillaceae bacterium]
MTEHFTVYILASKRNGTIYVGVTNDLVRRIHEHKSEVVKGFTEKYGVHRLVHFEQYDDPTTAIQREKNIKHWVRAWKVELIEKTNPTWRDLYEEIAVP